MGRWRWLGRDSRRFGEPADHDPTGPATRYQAHHGAYAAGAAPSETGDEQPGWNEPTDALHGWPQVTPRKRDRADGNGRWPSKADGQ